MPHYLMIKTCLKTGLKYLCKTSSRDPTTYHGSGKRWLLHLKKHHPGSPKFGINALIKTEIIGTYNTHEELAEAGRYFSELYDVVASPDWANLIVEQGDGGWINDQTGRTWKISDEARENVRKSRQQMREDGRASAKAANIIPKISGENNYQFKGFITTPWGRFATLRAATQEAKIQRKAGNKLVISDVHTLKRYIENLDIVLITPNIKVQWKGRTPREIGFDFNEGA